MYSYHSSINYTLHFSFHPNHQSRDGFPLCRTTCNATHMHRIARGTTLGVLPISTRRGVAVSYYDVKAETRNSRRYYL